MRPKVAIVILLLGTGLLMIIVLASKAVHPQPVASHTEQRAVSTVPANPVVPSAVHLPPVPVIAPVAVTNDPAVHEKYVHQRINELNGLAMNDDVASRDDILAEVQTNPDRRIRAAALEAAIQFGDRSVVPPLQAIAAQTGDPEEKQNILDAIDYINLPSLTEYRAANPSQSTTPSVKKIRRRTDVQPIPPALSGGP